MKEVLKPQKHSRREMDIHQVLQAVRLFERLGNCKSASEKTGVSRQKIYRAKDVIKTRGLRHFKKTFARRIHEDSKHKKLEDIVLQFSIKNPHLGENQVALHLNKRKNVSLSKGTVRLIWKKNNMQTIALRQKRS